MLNKKNFLKLIRIILTIWLGYLIFGLIGYRFSRGLISGEFETFEFFNTQTVISLSGSNNISNSGYGFVIDYPGNWRVLESGYLGLHFHEGEDERVRFHSDLINPRATVTVEQKVFNSPPTPDLVASWGEEILETRYGDLIVELNDVQMEKDYLIRTYKTNTQFYKDVYISLPTTGVIIRFETRLDVDSQLIGTFTIMVDSFQGK